MLPRMWRTHDFFGGFCFADTIGGRDILWKNIFMSDNIFEKEGGYCNSPPPPLLLSRCVRATDHCTKSQKLYAITALKIVIWESCKYRFF